MYLFRSRWYIALFLALMVSFSLLRYLCLALRVSCFVKLLFHHGADLEKRVFFGIVFFADCMMADSISVAISVADCAGSSCM